MRKQVTHGRLPGQHFWHGARITRSSWTASDGRSPANPPILRTSPCTSSSSLWPLSRRLPLLELAPVRRKPKAFISELVEFTSTLAIPMAADDTTAMTTATTNVTANEPTMEVTSTGRTTLRSVGMGRIAGTIRAIGTTIHVRFIGTATISMSSPDTGIGTRMVTWTTTTTSSDVPSNVHSTRRQSFDFAAAFLRFSPRLQSTLEHFHWSPTMRV
jgi:hypothetical protein